MLQRWTDEDDFFAACGEPAALLINYGNLHFSPLGFSEGCLHDGGHLASVTYTGTGPDGWPAKQSVSAHLDNHGHWKIQI